MLNIYMSSANGQLKEIEDIQNGCWINMVAPTEEEVHFVSERLQIPIDFFKDALDDEERSRIEKEECTMC